MFDDPNNLIVNFHNGAGIAIVRRTDTGNDNYLHFALSRSQILLIPKICASSRENNSGNIPVLGNEPTKSDLKEALLYQKSFGLPLVILADRKAKLKTTMGIQKLAGRTKYFVQNQQEGKRFGANTVLQRIDFDVTPNNELTSLRVYNKFDNTDSHAHWHRDSSQDLNDIAAKNIQTRGDQLVAFAGQTLEDLADGKIADFSALSDLTTFKIQNPQDFITIEKIEASSLAASL